MTTQVIDQGMGFLMDPCTSGVGRGLATFVHTYIPSTS